MQRNFLILGILFVVVGVFFLIDLWQVVSFLTFDLCTTDINLGPTLSEYAFEGVVAGVMITCGAVWIVYGYTRVICVSCGEVILKWKFCGKCGAKFEDGPLL